MRTTTPPIGIIGGSGLPALDLMDDVQEVEIATSHGSPSAPLLLGRLGGVPVAFLRRHGIGHSVPPTEINVRANVLAFKSLGVRQVLSLSAVGSLTEDLPPGSFVLVDQFIDRTYARAKTFFGPGLVGHVPFGSPVCTRMAGLIAEAGEASGVEMTRGGTYVVMEGPQFSTKAEAAFHRFLGAQIIGMTAMPEAKLCREAEICYAMIAMITDYDCWHEAESDVTAATVSEVMAGNAQKVTKLLPLALERLSSLDEACAEGCEIVLDGAIMTAPEAVCPDKAAGLGPILARVMPQYAAGQTVAAQGRKEEFERVMS